MATTSIRTRIQNRRDTLENWLSADPVLLQGELALVVGGGASSIKIGDGSSRFSQLPWEATPDLSSKQDVIVGTAAEWAAVPGFQPRRGQIVVWADHGTALSGGVELVVPGFKVGDGNAYNVDLPFVGDDVEQSLLSALAAHAADASHLSVGERSSWGHKITVGDPSDPSDDRVVGETHVITRN